MSNNILCWWFGCKPDPYCTRAPGYCPCVRCGIGVTYSDLVGDTKHNRFIENLKYYLFRKWVPPKCEYCGRRFAKCDDSIDHLPF